MKNRSIIYAQHQYAASSEPMYVVSIEFAPASFEWFASHAGIPDIPAGVIESTIEDFSAVSQSFNPETGVSRIGSLSVLLGDVAGAVTDAFQARLAAGTGVRYKQLRFYKGFRGLSFNDFELKWTQIIHEVSEDHARYTIACSDLQRAMRTEIFMLKTTQLDATLTATALTATVADTSEFILVEHGSSYAHRPNESWGYFKLDDEIIGYDGKTPTTFTGLDRGLFNTKPAEHVVPSDPEERRPQIEEYVYLQMPVPKLIKALMTGVLHGQGGETLPPDWHMGIDPTQIDDAQFTGIGLDLWDPTNDIVGLPVFFTDIGSINGKRFLETECYLLAQIFSPVLADGRLGLKRFTPVLAGAAHVVTLNESNVVKHSSLQHSMRELFNRILLNWSWVSGEFRRHNIRIDPDSIAKHGEAPIKIFNFRGLASNLATDSVLDQHFDSIRDRFSAPPLSMAVSVSKSLDRLELADVCLVQLPNVRDMAAESVNAIDRAFEIRQIRETRKQLTFMLSGSSARALPVAPSVNVLPDGYYDQEGIELSTVVTIVAGETQTDTFDLVGDPLLANSVFYYIGDLTIADGTILNIDHNVQLRVRGFVTLNGDINGVGRGLVGVVDGITTGDAPGGQLGFFGATAAGDGAEHTLAFPSFVSRPPGGGTIVAAASLPFLTLSVSGNTLNGPEADLRGCSGGPGGKLVNSLGAQVGAGGTGGPGGAGLMIVCRGMSFGGGASIDLSGGDGLSALQQTLGNKQFFGGGGAGGAPGALYILVDGDLLAPDVAPVFTARGGNTPIDGTPMPHFATRADQLAPAPATHTGFEDDKRRLDDEDWTDSAFLVRFIPEPQTPVEEQEELVPAPTALAAVGVLEGVLLTWINPPDGQFSTVEVWASGDNDIANAVKIADTVAEQFTEYMDNRAKRTRFYWLRSRDVDGNVSLYEPDTTTTTVTTEPLRERKNWLLDPEFDIGDPDPNWLGNVNGETEFWRGTVNGSSTADHVAGGGQSGSVAIDLWQDGTTSRTTLQHKKRVSFKGKNGTFLFQIKYRTEGSIDALDHDNFAVMIDISEFEFGGSSTRFIQSPLVTLPRSATFVTYETVWSFATSNNINWVSFAISLRNNQGTADKLRIDSIQVQSIGTEFGTVSASSQTKPGLVPLALSTDQAKFLKGDGTWGSPSAQGVDLFNGRIGDVLPIQADYDSFFLTPSEGNAAYSVLGHAHVAGDITSGIFAVARIPNLAASKITSGVFAAARIPTLSQYLRSNADDSFTGRLYVGSTSTRRAGMYGIYDSTKTGHIWSMGTAYVISATGVNFGNLYGMAYKHQNNTTGGTMAGGHQAVWCQNGVTYASLGNNIWAKNNYIWGASNLALPKWNTSGQTSGLMTISTAAASGGANGDIHYRY